MTHKNIFTRLSTRNIVSYILMLYLVCFAMVESHACSGYKITVGNTTIFGSNHDAWFTTPHIWFENANDSKYSAAFTGARWDGLNGYAPQTGMNEMGLAFERLVAYHPTQEKFNNKKTITNPTKYLKDILHSCKSVEEVKTYVSNYDHSYFIEDVFIYVDKSGKYLIVEPYSLILGSEPTYIMSNFCPSITPVQSATKIDRYRKGLSFVNNSIDTSLAFCTALSDTMHVCRGKIGDGTLLTSIWNLNNGTVNLYFYHNYKKSVQFNLSQEFKKGNHIIAIEKLFPFNKEFEKLRNFKTPKDSILIGASIIAFAGFFLFSSFYFLIKFLRGNKNKKYRYVQLLLFPLGIILFYYMYVLSGSVSVFYFAAPYKHPSNVFVSLTSYIPFLLAILIVPVCIVNYQLVSEKSWNFFSKLLFTANSFIFLILIGLFIYWQFYNVF